MKNSDSLVSIIIPTFNESENISECLSTLINQDYKNHEIIVIDDGSFDDTVSIVEKFPVKLIKQTHQGPARARNIAAKQALGKILVFVDADMTFSSNFITELTAPIITGQVRGAFSKNEYISNWDNTWSRCWNINQNRPGKKMIPDDYPNEGNDFRAILKDEFIKVGGFDDIGYTDTWSLYKKLGYRPIATSGAVYYHSNPASLKEVFIQSKWVAKRDYKLGAIGKLIALLRQSFPISILIGLFKSLKYKEPRFVIFKIVYDLGAFIGVLDLSTGGKLYK